MIKRRKSNYLHNKYNIYPSTHDFNLKIYNEYQFKNIYVEKRNQTKSFEHSQNTMIYKEWKNIQFLIDMNVSIHIEICIESKDCHDFHRLYSTEMNPCRCSYVRFPLLHWMPLALMKFMNSLCPDTLNTCFSPTHTTQTTKPSFHTSSISSSIISASSAVMYIEAWSMMTKKEAPVKIRNHIKILTPPTKLKKTNKQKKDSLTLTYDPEHSRSSSSQPEERKWTQPDRSILLG